MEKVLTARFTKRFRGGPEIQADLAVPSDRYSMTILYGPSGCGKTTVLRCLAGLDEPTSGIIRIDGETWYDGGAGLCRSPQQRRCGFVFQDYILFPHLSVEANIGFGLRGTAKADRIAMVEAMIERLDLRGLGRRRIDEISAGQKQRVALGRSLILKPRLLLLDEPFAALDTLLRIEMRKSIRSMVEEANIPCVLVTHDPDEAQRLGDTLVVMDNGSILQQGPVNEVFSSPCCARISKMLGQQG